jgi:hypothetical protein
MAEYMDHGHCHRAYRNDTTFKAVVDTLVALMDRMELTPGEARSIGTFAAVLREEREHRRVTRFPPLDLK